MPRPGAHKRLVIKSGRQKTGRHIVDRAQIVRQRWPAILADGLEPVIGLDDGRPRVGLGAGTGSQPNQRVGFLDTGRIDAARPVILETAGDQRDPRWPAAQMPAYRRDEPRVCARRTASRAAMSDRCGHLPPPCWAGRSFAVPAGGVARQHYETEFMGQGVSFDQEPVPAPLRMVPIFEMHSSRVVAQEKRNRATPSDRHRSDRAP